MRRRQRGRMPQDGNPWKLATLGILGVIGTGVLAGTVIAHYDSAPAPAAKPIARSVEVRSVRQAASAPTAEAAPAKGPASAACLVRRRVPPTASTRRTSRAVSPPWRIGPA